MLSVHLIQKHFEARRFDPLLAGVAANGMHAPLPLEARLGLTPVPAVALALRRLVELTFGPTSLGSEMVEFLLARQQPDGRFTDAPAPGSVPADAPGNAAVLDAPGLGDPLATACVVAALDQVLREHPAAGPLVTLDRARVRSAHDRALAALTDMQSQNPDYPGFKHPHDRTREDRDLTTAFILALLASHEGFRGSVRFAEMLDDLDDRQNELDEPTQRLWLMARLDAACDARRPIPPTPPAPARALVAA